jgi:alkyl hydroperoxide reductase subunit AhpF
MNRRNFFKSKIAGTAILASSGLVCKASAENPPTVNEKTSILDVDVLVVGGGSAGHVAAIQAGRLGAKTVLLERNSQLGGTTTTGGVCFPGLFHAWGKQVISGIGWELVAKSVEVDGRKLQDFTNQFPTDSRNNLFTPGMEQTGKAYASGGGGSTQLRIPFKQNRLGT